ncbi:SDR family NAD(P)-dependent oxidoreductase [Promicromonospora panici]|uniref:SDR family NAD(P)-dependent oxidoreductase n=1 Tax=Promicromonospora panici TaxID=2219658 RepID=UPI00101DD9BB|nr:SDR family oxidoreductase [Promicromonospora panici]
MLLEQKVALVFGAGGAIGRTVARAFADEGAQVFLSGRNLAAVEAVADEIGAAGGKASAARVDALDEDAVNRHVSDVVQEAGRIDVVLNAIGFKAVQGVSLTDIDRDDFLSPIVTWTTAQFLTARAAARYMVRERSGVVLTLSASPARLAIASTGGFGVACAAIEGLSRTLAAELSPHGVRVVCIRPHRIGDTLGPDPDFPMAPDEFRSLIENMTLLKRLPTLENVASTAAFLASDGAAAMSGTVADLTGGMSVD